MLCADFSDTTSMRTIEFIHTTVRLRHSFTLASTSLCLPRYVQYNMILYDVEWCQFNFLPNIRSNGLKIPLIYVSIPLLSPHAIIRTIGNLIHTLRSPRTMSCTLRLSRWCPSRLLAMPRRNSLLPSRPRRPACSFSARRFSNTQCMV